MKRIPVGADERHPHNIEALLEAAIRRLVRDEVRELGVRDVDPYVPHTAWPMPRRLATRAARRINGACKVGRCWYARQSVVDAFIASHAAPKSLAEPCASDDPCAGDGIDRKLVQLGFCKRGAR